jgi:cell division protein FtsZ
MERAPVVEQHPHPGAFIPPRAEEVIRPTRMPRVDELPLPAQAQFEQRNRQAAPQPQPEKKRVTLMERLSQAGFKRKHEEPSYAPPAPAPQQRAAQPQQYAPQQPQPASSVHQEYAKRPTAPVAQRPQQGLDQHGRPMSPPRQAEDDHLEIPAFLRRQSN